MWTGEVMRRVNDPVVWEEEQHRIWQQDRELWNLGDERQCRTVDTTMAVLEWSQDCQWKQRTHSGQHRCLDVKRCKGGEYHRESWQEC